MKPKPKQRLFVAGYTFRRTASSSWALADSHERPNSWEIKQAMLDRIAELEAEVEELREKKT